MNLKDKWLIYNIFKRILVLLPVVGISGFYILKFGIEAFLYGLGVSTLMALVIAYFLMLFASD